MRRVPALILAATLGAGSVLAQQAPQFHGFATEGFLYSGSNNYLGMDTSSGSGAWIEAAVSGNEQISDQVRVGAQVHFTRLGKFGDSIASVDWALVDWKLNQRLGLRAGKVKIRWGLYNDTQDADPGYLWSLLPESMYAVDVRATNLSQYGAELYGGQRLGDKLGELGYSLYYGYYFYAPNDGYMEGFREQGLSFTKRPGGITPGFDLRWKTPVKGLMLGGSLMLYNASGNLVNGAFRQPLTYWPAYYAQYDIGKLSLVGQYMRLVQYTDLAIAGEARSIALSDSRAWFSMASYRLTDKLQIGAYHTRYLVTSSGQESDPANHFYDSVVSGRYDVNSYFYLKLEGHYIDGNGLGFYGFDNPNGLKPHTNLLVAKVGFSF